MPGFKYRLRLHYQDSRTLIQDSFALAQLLVLFLDENQVVRNKNKKPVSHIYNPFFKSNIHNYSNKSRPLTMLFGLALIL